MAARFLLPIAVIVFLLSVSACRSGSSSPQPTATKPARSSSQTQVDACQAAKYEGQTSTVTGTVEDALYATWVKGAPTYLNFGSKYPDNCFTVVIWGRDRPKFPVAPESAYSGKRLQVTGKVEMYAEKPEMTVTDPDQVVVLK